MVLSLVFPVVLSITSNKVDMSAQLKPAATCDVKNSSSKLTSYTWSTYVAGISIQ